MSVGPGQLEYLISEKEPYLVVTFIGEMTKSTIDALEKCHTVLSGRNDILFVLNMRDVSKIETLALAPLVKLQKTLRDKKGAMRICALRPDLAKFLLEKAAIRDNELENNLTAAL